MKVLVLVGKVVFKFKSIQGCQCSFASGPQTFEPESLLLYKTAFLNLRSGRE